MQLNLENKIVMITGGSKGIGKAICEVLKEEGMKVMDFSRSSGFFLTKERDLDRAKKLINNIPCDILINNVGGGGTWESKYWKEILLKNYGITYELTSEYLSKQRKWGRVITISSIYGKEKGGTPQFNAAKSAQISYMKNLAGKYKGITFNTICPGHINVGKIFLDKPKIIGEPKDVAYLTAFLCSDLAKHINGACITVDGGTSYSF